MTEPTRISLIGVALGQNLVLNMNDNGYQVSVYGRTTRSLTRVPRGPSQGTRVVDFHDLKELVDSLKKPRRVAVELVNTTPLSSSCCWLTKATLSSTVTPIRHPASLGRSEREERSAVGSDVSGGEEGARHGHLSCLAGLKHGRCEGVFQAIGAKVGDSCCDWVGQWCQPLR